jgi:HD-GYP domain-containing protein (c-di-GMP phosphodiesterase class II)
MLMFDATRCDHARGHSGRGRFLDQHAWLRFSLVCDDCGAERGEVRSLSYHLHAKPFANNLAELTARELGLEQELLLRVRLAALLCDVAQAQIPATILRKTGPLSDEDWQEIHRHPEMGAAMLSGASFDDIRAWIMSHHERPDGRGYPRGLRGEEIPLEARILAVADAYEAMTNDRPYRPAMTHELACRELLGNAGTQFDGRVVKAFLRAVKQVRRPAARAL